MQLFPKFKKILRRGFRATLNFQNFKVALNPSRVAKIIPTFSPVIGQFSDTMIVASIDEEW